MPLQLPMRTARRLLPGGFVLLATLLALALAPAASRADACSPPTNPVACENSKPGAEPLDWEVDNNGDSAIQGYATSMSVNVGDTINFKIKSSTAAYHLDIYRLGYYQGLRAPPMASNVAPANTAPQPACQTFADTGLVDCGNWSVSAAWTVPSTAVSGVYVANLVFN